MKIIGYSVPEARIIKLESYDNDCYDVNCYGGVEYIEGAHNLALNASMIKFNENKTLSYCCYIVKFIL